MTANLDDACRAYEAAKRISAAHETMQPLKDDAKILFTNASQDYAQALVDHWTGKLDAMGVVIGETTVTAEGIEPFVIQKLEANIHFGRAVAVSEGNASWAWVDEIRPYVAPVAKEMVLGSPHGFMYGPFSARHRVRLTLSNVTPADLDGMTGTITGTYILDKL